MPSGGLHSQDMHFTCYNPVPQVSLALLRLSFTIDALSSVAP